MFRRKRAPLSTRPYDKMHLAIEKGYKRRRWRIPASILGLLAVAIVWAVEYNKLPQIELLSVAFLWGAIAFATLPMLLLADDNISRTDNENRLVNTAIEFLNRSHYSEEVVETIDKRAEIGSNAGQIRTLFPILAIPIILPFLGGFRFGLNMGTAIMFSVLSLIILAFLRELDRANTDVVIRHAIAEYQGRHKIKEAQERYDCDTAKNMLMKYSNYETNSRQVK